LWRYRFDGAIWRKDRCDRCGGVAALGGPYRGLVVHGLLLYKYFPDARGSGVPQTKAALFARGGRISLRTVFGKFFCTSATLASGIPLGREGPSVQVGAGIASVLGRALGLSPEKIKALIPVGAAAAVAAAFNTPLAAVLFALEEVVGDLHAPVLGSVVLASATSWAVLRLLLGNDPLFKVPQYQLVSPVELFIYAVLGLLGVCCLLRLQNPYSSFATAFYDCHERPCGFSRRSVESSSASWAGSCPKRSEWAIATLGKC